MANEVNFNELFGNFSAADALAATETKKTGSFSSDGLYKPSIKDEKCTDQNYRALVRFIPFYHEGKWRTTVSRWECFLKDVNGDNGIFVVSPKTNGQKCPMRALSYKLYTSDSAIDKSNSKKISVYQQYYALVEVVKDIQHPEYDGKIFIYQFGQKINDKIENAMKSTEFTEGFNPFDLYNGRLFEINLTKDTTKKMDEMMQRIEALAKAVDALQSTTDERAADEKKADEDLRKMIAEDLNPTGGEPAAAPAPIELPKTASAKKPANLLQYIMSQKIS